MGYERKRGKLMQFNAFLRGRCADCFAAVVGDLTILPEIKYVITLDTDTQLPRESARQLIGTMAHPLNRPQFDPALGIVTEGYSLLQPRVDVSLPTADRSRFVRLHAGEVGIDPYTRTVSDVYQDLFGEGSFIGKGVYDVDAFQRTLAGRFPENRIPEPRLAGIGLRTLRVGERRDTLRGISVALRDRRRPAAPLDSRRLANFAVAAAARSRRGGSGYP